MSAEIELHTTALEAIQTNPDRQTWSVAVADHVADCDRCRATIEASLRLRSGVRATLGSPAPTALLERVQAKLAMTPESNSTTPARTHWGQRVWVPAALAAGLLLGVGLGPVLRGTDDGAPRIVDGEVVKTVGDYLFDVTHDRHLLERTGRPIEHAGSDRAEISDWLTQGTGFDVALGNAPGEWQLSGGRVWHTVSRISALAEYDFDGHRITVFAVPAAGILLDEFEDHRVDDDMWATEAWALRGVAWYEGELLWSAVGDSSEDELVEWVRHYRSDASD